MSECIFCKIASKEIPSKTLYEDDDMVVFEDLNKKAPVHCLIVPRKHIESVFELEQADNELIGKMISKAKEIAKMTGIEETGLRLVINAGSDGGQEVPHIHIHMLGGRRMEWPPG